MKGLYPYRFDVEAIFEAFGGVAAVRSIMARHGVPIRRKSVNKWKERSAIPADAIALLIKEAEATGVNSDEFICKA